MLNYTDITQNTYIQSWTVTEIMAREVWNWQEYVVSGMLISVLNIKVTCEWYKAIKLNYKNTRNTAAAVLGFQALCISGSNEVLSYRIGQGSCSVKLANVSSSRSQMTSGRGGCIAL